VQDQLITTRAAASLLGVGTTSIKRWADEGTLPCVRTAGGHRRFRRNDVLALLHSGDPEAAPPPDVSSTDLPGLSAGELDALPFGVVQLDDDARIVQYNAYEERFANRRREDVVGRNFFTEVAPCTNNQLLYGRFRDGVAAGAMDFELDYTFTYKMRPRVVGLHLLRDPDTGTNWLLVRPH